MKILQINTTVNTGSTGRIAEDIGKVLIANKHESYIAFGRGNRPSCSTLVKIGYKKDIVLHGFQTAIFDRHGFGSLKATENLILEIRRIRPDAILLHNLHGYYINIGILFEYLAEAQIPVLWTLFDCWAFTGHCSYFDDVNCVKWKTQCRNCPKTKAYPSSYFFDNSLKNFNDKKRLFNSITRMKIIVHSKWLRDLVENSFLKNYEIYVTPSGTDLKVFRPINSDLIVKYKLPAKKIILGCTNIWSSRKGFQDFINLNHLMDGKYQIVLIGLNKKQLRLIPKDILGIARTENVEELAAWYSLADVYVNPTYSDNFPTTNIEALACGTPVITYNTGGSPEAIDEHTGLVVKKGDYMNLLNAIEILMSNGKSHYSEACRKRAISMYNKDDRYGDYLNTIYSMVNSKN